MTNKIKIEFEDLSELEFKVKEYIEAIKLPNFIFELENQVFRPPRKHGEEEFLKKCFGEFLRTSDVNLIIENAFNYGCMAAHAVLEEEYYNLKNKHKIGELL